MGGRTFTATFPILPFEKYLGFVETCGEAKLIASRP